MAGYDKDPLYKDCVFDLDFTEGSGNPCDSAKAHHPMTMSGTPTWTTVSPNGVLVNVLSFTDTHPDYIRCLLANSADLNFTTQNFTTALWMYAGASGALGYSAHFNFGGWSSGKGYGQFMENTRTYFVQVGSATIVTSAGYIPPNLWTFMVITRTGVNALLYKNSFVTHSSGTVPASITQSLLDFDIGHWGAANQYNYNGLFYRPRVWSRALSPAEIWELFRRERQLFGV